MALFYLGLETQGQKSTKRYFGHCDRRILESEISSRLIGAEKVTQKVV